MNQVSRPMQIALGAALVFAVLWFVALRPKDPVVDPIAAAPVASTPAETPRANAGGAKAESALGKTIEGAKDKAASADADTAAREKLTGEDPAGEAAAANTPTPTSTPSAAAPATGTAAATGTSTPAAKPAAGADADKAQTSASQKRADRMIVDVKRDLAARRAVVVLVWQKDGKEDKILYKRITKDINRRGGRVRTYFIKVGEVGRYDGLLSGLSLGQTPSTLVIAPNNEAKVIGGLTSVARIDRLTSSAILTKPVATTP